MCKLLFRASLATNEYSRIRLTAWPLFPPLFSPPTTPKSIHQTKSPIGLTVRLLVSGNTQIGASEGRHDEHRNYTSQTHSRLRPNPRRPPMHHVQAPAHFFF